MPAAASRSELRCKVSFITSASNGAVGDRDRGQADAVDRDRVAWVQLGRQAAGDRQPGAIRGALRAGDPPKITDKAGEHRLTTP